MKTNKGLVEYAKAQLGLPYWYGTFGNTAAADLYEYKRDQYPQYYKAWNDFPKQYGKRVHDCVGLIKGYLWSDTPTSKPVYNSKQDVSANGMLSVCSEKGGIYSMPDVPGVLVFMKGHVGVYIGNGEVIEARGHEYGVVKTKLKARPWVSWGKCPWIDYGEKDDERDIPLRIVRGTWVVRSGAGKSFTPVRIVGGDKEYTAGKVKNGWYFIEQLGGWVSPKAVDVL